jgi:hypothetical protein
MGGLTVADLIKPAFRQWAQHARDLGFNEFIAPEDAFTTELTSNTKWANHLASGIYTWITEAGDAYVGQAVKVRARLKQHWKNHRSMAYAAFQPVERDGLDREEQRLIAAMETAFPVLNIAFAKSSTTTVPFDGVVTQEERQEFLNGDHLAENGNWQQWPLLLRKQAGKFEVLESDDLYCIALRAIRIYVERCIPKPKSTEVKFWSVTLHNDSLLYFRLNVGQQEVFTLWNDGKLLARVIAQAKLVSDAEGPIYATKSYINWLPVADLDSWLMRHTTPIHSRSHCPQLVRAAFANPTPCPC